MKTKESAADGDRSDAELVFANDQNPSETAARPTRREVSLALARRGERPGTQLERVARLIEEEIQAGSTYLHVPRERASWLDVNPELAEYLASRFEIVEASQATGITFALTPANRIGFSLEAEGWQAEDGAGTTFVATRRLIDPRVILRPDMPAAGKLRGRIALTCQGPKTLCIRYVSTRSGRPNPSKREIFLSLERPWSLWHDLPFVEIAHLGDGAIDLDFDLKVNGGRVLDEIVVELVEEDNWRMHPGFDGGETFMLKAVAPAASGLEMREVSLCQTEEIRRGPAHGRVRGALPATYRRAAGQRRDAVIFSSWIPEEALALGDYFIEVLKRWHADSKIFVGINHGSSPEWRARLESSGLDLAIREASTTIAIAADPPGFVAALDEFRRQSEAFDLVWFGHTKGAGHVDERWYFTGHWTIERMFWSRREEIAAYFGDPTIGLYSPHYLMMLQSHLAQTDALQRLYQATCAPLGLMAVATHFTMRSESVRDFCDRVDPRFFIKGPVPFGGDKFFFEMAMPNVPLMQGYEPFIEPGLGGTSGVPTADGVASVVNDWRQNNAVTAIELEKWRRRPTRFRTKHREHNRHD